ncbi:MAG TPA: SCO family protein, partial [Thermoanaerobaculia bacterium]|nr:SCO family protein [Thermoanaerobaculia bacterium]
MTRRVLPLVSAAAILLAAVPAPAQKWTGMQGAAPLPAPPTKEVGFDQKLGGQVPLDLAFRDETGKDVKLSQYFGKKPVVLHLMYFECPMLCGMSIEGLLRSLRALSWDVGKEFEVVTVSFDAREGPTLAAAKKANVIETYARPGADAGWHFLTGSEASIRALTQAVGFRYVWDAEQKQFAHATGIVILTPGGKISRYFFGIEYPTKDLRLGLIDSTVEKIGSLTDQLLLMCYHYDPRVGRYTPAINRLLKGAAALTAVGLAAFVLALFRR